VGLPDTDGRELCRRMRKQGVKCPIMMLTGHDTDSDTILGLDAGANDYVTKPFKFPVLLARIRAQLRTHEQSEDAVFQLGPYTFKPAQKMLVDEKEKKIRLTEKETNILKYLYRATRRAWWRAMCCCTRSGATTPASPPTRWKPTSTACARRSSPIPRTRGCWSPKAEGPEMRHLCHKPSVAEMQQPENLAVLGRIVAGIWCYLLSQHKLCIRFPWSRRGYGVISSLLDLAGLLPGLFFRSTSGP
jgi:hypothetical protein